VGLILSIRYVKQIVFIYGSSQGFYDIFYFVFLMTTPYAFLIGFGLMLSLFIAQKTSQLSQSVSTIYIWDTVGDALGGGLFTFCLIYFCTPIAALILSGMPLLAVSLVIWRGFLNKSPIFLFIVLIFFSIGYGVAIIIEQLSLRPYEGRLVHYKESRYGRIQVYQMENQYAIMQDGAPVFTSENEIIAEELSHYPLSQLAQIKHVLLLCAEGNMIQEVEKYHPQRIDYVELDDALANAAFQFGMLSKSSILRLIHQDGRQFLSQTTTRYDAIIMNMPEPNTFQINRFYTAPFFKKISDQLTQQGIFCFTTDGFDSYLSSSQVLKLSSLVMTAKQHFKYVQIIPGQKNYILCSQQPIQLNIPDLLSHKHIQTAYVSGYYEGDIPLSRHAYVNELIEDTTPINTDFSPFLIQMAFKAWFEKYHTPPTLFFILISCIAIIYSIQLKACEFVLFSTGLTLMGFELAIIFVFQIIFGYIYSMIGGIVTLFIIGLLPGALFAKRFNQPHSNALLIVDFIMVIILSIFIAGLAYAHTNLFKPFLLISGFLMSLCCGFQFPIASKIMNRQPYETTRLFAADLMGAAFGTLLMSIVFMPYLGMYHSLLLLIAVKCLSMIFVLKI